MTFFLFGYLSNPSIAFANAVLTSRYRGSPSVPALFVLSRTAILLTVSGIAFTNSIELNGLNRRTFNSPIFSFLFFINQWTVSSTVSQPEPIITITYLASLAPIYSNGLYFLPVSFPKSFIESLTMSYALS